MNTLRKGIFRAGIALGIATVAPALAHGEDTVSVLNQYPKAPAACLEARVYNGQTYMKVKAKVYVGEQPMLSVDIMDPYGNTLGTVLVRKPKSLRVLINGKEVDAFDLHRDQALTLWVPQSMFDARAVAASH
jgi:hypothetical protein